MVDKQEKKPLQPVFKTTPAIVALGLAVRLEQPSDVNFLLHLYLVTRWHELASLGHWTESQKIGFLDQQFRAKHSHYARTYHDGEFLIIEYNAKPVGRLVLHRAHDGDIRVVDISLLPDRCGRGFGTALIEAVIAEAEAGRRSVSLHVDNLSLARRLYQRLGFHDISAEGPHHLMQRRPGV